MTDARPCPFKIGDHVTVNAPYEAQWHGRACRVVGGFHNGRNWRYHVCPVNGPDDLTAEFSGSELDAIN